MTRVSVIGLGYVGSVTAACLAREGHTVIGNDINPQKVEMIASGQSPVIETGLAEVIAEQRRAGRLTAVADTSDAVRETDVTLICVGTPSRSNGSLDVSYIHRVSEEIGAALATKSDYHVVVVRSTVLPGTTESVVIPRLESASGKCVGEGYGVVYNPEFLREGTSIQDFLRPPYTVIGGRDERARKMVAELYANVSGPVEYVDYRVAEIVKYVSNAFHALKVTFANEVGAICKAQGIDSHQVMQLFCEDRKLNISSAYLMPGFAFGGSCLPKDVRALVHASHAMDLFPPVLEAILPSNRGQIDRAYALITSGRPRRIGFLGFSFKAGTDDLRESPLVDLIERLIGKGYEVCVYDRNVSLASLQGANRAYIEKEIPHIASIMKTTAEEVLAGSDVVVVGNADPEFRSVVAGLRAEQRLVDLVRLSERTWTTDAAYEGIAW